MKKLTDVYNVIESKEFTTKVTIYMAAKVPGDDYDPLENNTRDHMLAPKTIKAYVRDISPEALVWKQYGLANIGAKELICRKSYITMFKYAAKIVIEGKSYQIFKGTGKLNISERPGQMIRVVLTLSE